MYFFILGFESEVVIIFIVKDMMLLMIIGFMDFYVDVGIKFIDYKIFINYIDNYMVDKDLILNIYVG